MNYLQKGTYIVIFYFYSIIELFNQMTLNDYWPSVPVKNHKEDNVEDRETSWTSKRGTKEEQRDSMAVPQISQMAVFAGTKQIIYNVET